MALTLQLFKHLASALMGQAGIKKNVEGITLISKSCNPSFSVVEQY